MTAHNGFKMENIKWTNITCQPLTVIKSRMDSKIHAGNLLFTNDMLKVYVVNQNNKLRKTPNVKHV